SFAKAMGLEIVKPFCKYDDKIEVGVICKTSLKSIEEIKELIKISFSSLSITCLIISLSGKVVVYTLLIF
ncbi:hypothetical protein D1N57_20875, partial [Clostridioides difficile]